MGNKQSQRIWISAVHIPGRHNIDADKKNRKCLHSTQWMLSDKTFSLILKIFGNLTLDLFAS